MKSTTTRVRAAAAALFPLLLLTVTNGFVAIIKNKCTIIMQNNRCVHRSSPYYDYYALVKGCASTRRWASSLSETNDNNYQNPLLSLNKNLDSLAKQSSSQQLQEPGAASRAQELLQRIEALHNEGYYAVSPDVVSLNSVLNAWARDETDPDATSKALQLMLSRYPNNQEGEENNNNKSDSKNSNRIIPNIISFNTVILAFAKRGASKEARDLLNQMKNATFEGVEPDIITYNSVLYAHAIAQEPKEAELLLKDMIASSSLSMVKFDNNNDENNNNNNITMERRKIIERKPQPDTISFNTVLLAWAKSTQRGRNYARQQKQQKKPHQKIACARAEEILRHMEKLYEAGNDHVEPDVYSYTLVLQALSQDRRPAATERAMKLLKHMEMLSTKEGREHLSPNTVTYTNVITALCNSGDPKAAMKAEILLNNMIDRYENEGGVCICIPDTVTFTAVITCWGRGYQHDEGPNRALALLGRMQQMGDLAPPNALTYISVLKALAHSQTSTGVDTATSLLKEMIDAYDNGNFALEPTTIHYNIVLDVFAKSSHHDKAVQAYDLYEQMLAQNSTKIQPNIITYNSILRACANTFGSPETKSKAFVITMRIFDKIIKTCKPSSITFLFLLKALRKLDTSDKNSNSENTQWKYFVQSFQYCCKLGLVNDIVLGQVKLACSNEQQRQDLFPSKIVQNHAVRMPDDDDWSAADLPTKWTNKASQFQYKR